MTMKGFRKEKGVEYVVTGARSVGALFLDAHETAAILHRHYWDTGVIWGSGVEAIHPNPAMNITGAHGTKFAVHYGTDPSLPLHVAPAYAELSKSDPLYRPHLGSKATSDDHATRVADIARSEFSIWSSPFRQWDFNQPLHSSFGLWFALRYVCVRLWQNVD
jgi:hypothetical protein